VRITQAKTELADVYHRKKQSQQGIEIAEESIARSSSEIKRLKKTLRAQQVELELQSQQLQQAVAARHAFEASFESESTMKLGTLIRLALNLYWYYCFFLILLTI
jgi:hypothetical protein